MKYAPSSAGAEPLAGNSTSVEDFYGLQLNAEIKMMEEEEKEKEEGSIKEEELK
jgi:hypothetical protein